MCSGREREALKRDQAAPQSAADSFGAIGDTELAADRGDMELDCLIADAEACRDALVRQALGQQLEHVVLARRQRLLSDFRPLDKRRGGDAVGCDEKPVGAQTGVASFDHRRRFAHDVEAEPGNGCTETGALRRTSNQDNRIVRSSCHGVRTASVDRRL